jgi:acyl transferase domain-containing protein
MPAFREAFDAVGAGLEFLVKPTGPGSGATSPGGPGLAALLEPAERPEWIDSPVVSQLAVFAVEYALTKLLSKVGLVPDLLCGYSVGEYAAATTAGVFGLEHVMTVLARRAELIERTAPAGMLTVLDSRERIADRLAAIGQPDLVVSAIDGPRLCVVSGPAADVDALTAALTAEGIATRRVPARHGFHSPMLRGIEADIAACVAAGDLHPPTIAMTSNTSGGRLAPDDAVDPRYWSRHASHPVLFDDHIDLLRQQPDPLLIEVGPGRMLTSLVLAKPGRPARVRATATLPEPDRTGHDVAGVLSAMGRAWAWGAPVDLPSVAAL